VEAEAKRTVKTSLASRANGRNGRDPLFAMGSRSKKMSFRTGAVRAERSAFSS
jgi:hypothetical protein